MRGLLVGRFQPFHHGHLAVVREVRAKRPDEELILGIGSAQESFTWKNPFTSGERMEMVSRALHEAGVDWRPLRTATRHSPARAVGPLRRVPGSSVRTGLHQQPADAAVVREGGIPRREPPARRSGSARGRGDPHPPRLGGRLGLACARRRRPLPGGARRPRAARDASSERGSFVGGNLGVTSPDPEPARVRRSAFRFEPLPPWVGPTTRLVHGARRPEWNAGAVVPPI